MDSILQTVFPTRHVQLHGFASSELNGPAPFAETFLAPNPKQKSARVEAHAAMVSTLVVSKHPTNDYSMILDRKWRTKKKTDIQNPHQELYAKNVHIIPSEGRSPPIVYFIHIVFSTTKQLEIT